MTRSHDAMTRGTQTEIPGTEPPDIPEIRDAIYAWEDAKEKAASEGRLLRDAAKAAEAKALELVAEAGLKSYPYVDRESGKRKRFQGVQETKAKTFKAPTSSDKPAKKSDSPAQDRAPKPTKAERDAARVESRRVPRTAEHDQAADPFGGTRGLLDRAKARQLAEEAVAAAEAMGATFVVPQDGGS
jgi:hypothetical protein